MTQNIPKIPLFVNAIKFPDGAKPVKTGMSAGDFNGFLNLLLLNIGNPDSGLIKSDFNTENGFSKINLLQPAMLEPQQFFVEPFKLAIDDNKDICLLAAARQLLITQNSAIDETELDQSCSIQELLWPQPQRSYQAKQEAMIAVAELPVQEADIDMIQGNFPTQNLHARSHHNHEQEVTIDANLSSLNENGPINIEIAKQSNELQPHKDSPAYPYQLLDISHVSINPAKVCYKYEITEERLVSHANNQLTTHITSIKNSNGKVEKITVQLEPVHLGNVEIIFSPNQYMNDIQINVEKESTYFMLKHNSSQLISMLGGVGLNQGQINLNFSLQHKKEERKWNNNSTHNESNVESIESGLDKSIKTASIWFRGSVRGVSWLI